MSTIIRIEATSLSIMDSRPLNFNVIISLIIFQKKIIATQYFLTKFLDILIIQNKFSATSLFCSNRDSFTIK